MYGLIDSKQRLDLYRYVVLASLGYRNAYCNGSISWRWVVTKTAIYEWFNIFV